MVTDDDAVRIRPATAADAPSVGAIWRDGWRDGHLGHVPEELVAIRTPESFDLRAAQRVGDTTVAEVAGEVAGFVMVVADEVEQVYVAAARRGTGVAGALLAEGLRQVGGNGHPRAWLAVAGGNARARRFYERQGWTDEGAFDYPARSSGGPIAVRCHRYTRQV
ncbi:GNAT family N-acetyltransferase [Catellatospora coxensis]|uniref:N-acetyltransferase n=1 Tax=Catellatospora coxensis TaxID=310354 RepID=A0A8J3KWI6_9ACTN|nr:GNAT family N-acetyltransferase [Catellatospora coxensis]GIG06554.1 N-acetyltransferase [Catellatospora coxensis]